MSSLTLFPSTIVVGSTHLMTFMTKIYTDTEQKIWVRITSSDLTLSFSEPSLTRSLLTCKRLELSRLVLRDVLYFNMVSGDGVTHIQNLCLKRVNELPDHDVWPI